jgi:molybdate transport system substrate-binding protein
VNNTTRSALAGVLALVFVSGCAAQPEPSPGTSTGGATITVFAAASLKKAFTEIGERFEADNPGDDVEFSFAGSADLATQLTQGAPADVFAAADTANMDKVAQAGLLSTKPADFASNTLTIAVAPGNPTNITALKDLTRPGISVVICAPQVPCGSATEKVEQAGGVQLDPVSEESSVSDVLNKVTTGQADAGLVYVTDVLAAGDRVTGVAFPESAGVVNTYPIGVLTQSANPEAARRFVDLVTGEAGQNALAAVGFAKP